MERVVLRAARFALPVIAVVALATAAISSASASANKAFTVAISPGTIGGAPTTMTAVVANESDPQGLGAAHLAPPNGFTVSSATITSGSGSASVVSDSNCLTNTSPATASPDCVELSGLTLTPGQSVTVTMNVTKAPSGCPASTYTWGADAKQSNSFNGPPGNTLTWDKANSSYSTTVNGVCSLKFATQPHSAVVTQHITGTDYDQSGPPVTVDLLDGKGAIDTGSSAPVTITLGSNPGAGTLSGTTTVNAVNGVATFGDLSIDKPANGYALTASTASTGSTTSSSFDEQNQSVPCQQDQTCETDVGNVGGDTKVVANPQSGTNNAGLLYESVNAQNNAPLNCAGYTSADPNVYELNVTTPNRSKVVTTTIKQPAIPLSGTETAILGSQQICFGAPYEFVTASGSNAPAGTLPDGTQGFVGLLPNCGAAGATVCISNRSGTLDALSPLGFDIVVTWNVPAGLPGDPWGR
jgi:hypothetical protein